MRRRTFVTVVVVGLTLSLAAQSAQAAQSTYPVALPTGAQLDLLRSLYPTNLAIQAAVDLTETIGSHPAAYQALAEGRSRELVELLQRRVVEASFAIARPSQPLNCNAWCDVAGVIGAVFGVVAAVDNFLRDWADPEKGLLGAIGLLLAALLLLAQQTAQASEDAARQILDSLQSIPI